MKSRASRIKSLIEESGNTYQELEQITGIKKSSLQRYASGETVKIPLSAIEKLANAFNVSVSFLMWGTEEKKSSEISLEGLSTAKADLIRKVMQMSDEELKKLDLLLQIVEAKQ